MVTIEVLVEPAAFDEPCDTIAPLAHDVLITLEQELGSRTVRGREQDPDLQEVPRTVR